MTKQFFIITFLNSISKIMEKNFFFLIFFNKSNMLYINYISINVYIVLILLKNLSISFNSYFYLFYIKYFIILSLCNIFIDQFYSILFIYLLLFFDLKFNLNLVI